MGISVLLNKTICKSELSFNELELQFYDNLKQLKQLDAHSQKYHELYHENESILEQVDQLNRG